MAALLFEPGNMLFCVRQTAVSDQTNLAGVHTMANSSETLLKMIGLILVVGGAGLAFWGYQMSDSLASQLSKTLTGALPDAVMYRYIGGAVSAVAGLFLLVKR